MVGICIERERAHMTMGVRKNISYMGTSATKGSESYEREWERVGLTVKENERENMAVIFVISNWRYKLIDFQYIKLSKVIVII